MGSDSGTPVSAQRIWHEHVEKELKFQVVRTDYTWNPATVLLLPEKPTDLKREKELMRMTPNGNINPSHVASPSSQASSTSTSSTSTSAAASTLSPSLDVSRSDLIPPKKYAHPLTSAHEIGWDLEFAKRHAFESDPFRRPHTSDPDAPSSFADKYVLNHGSNPFSTAQFKYMPRNAINKK